MVLGSPGNSAKGKEEKGRCALGKRLTNQASRLFVVCQGGKILAANTNGCSCNQLVDADGSPDFSVSRLFLLLVLLLFLNLRFSCLQQCALVHVCSRCCDPNLNVFFTNRVKRGHSGSSSLQTLSVISNFCALTEVARCCVEIRVRGLTWGGGLNLSLCEILYI